MSVAAATPDVLVVDDELSICRSCERILAREGYEVKTVQTGRDALALLTHQPVDIGEQAARTRVVHHSDRGTQYAARQYRERLEALGIQGSMARTGNPYDNARVESFFKTLKHEEVYAFEYETMQDVLERLPTFLEETYNRRRLHSSLGYVPPEEFELVYDKTEGQNPEPCPST